MFRALLLIILFPLSCHAVQADKTSSSAPPKTFHHPEAFLKSLEGSKHKGEQIYTHFCGVCHAKHPRIFLGAPRIGVKEDWLIRMKDGVTAMLKRIDPGLNAMPPRGGCFECSDKDLKAAILYMLPKKTEKYTTPGGEA